MFCAARICRAVPPFSIFLMDQKNNPDLKGVAIGTRAQLLSKMYKALPATQRKDLHARARKHPSMNKKKPRARRAKSGFSIFVKENYAMVRGLNHSKRFSALSQLYELQKPVDLGEELRKMGVDPNTVNIKADLKAMSVALPGQVRLGGMKAKVVPAQNKVKKAARTVKVPKH